MKVSEYLVANCPCGSGRHYQACCAAYHLGMRYPETPKALLRSRYTAFVLLNEDYLQLTWREKTRPLLVLDEVQHRIIWDKMVIIDARRLGLSKACIRFRVDYQLDGDMHSAEELSYFIKEAGRWYYDESVF